MPPDLAALGGSAHQHLGGYYGMVKRLDEALGRLLDALKSLGLRDNTIVLFTSDHGYHFKTRNAEYKRSCHESSIRVPTAMQRSGLRRAAGRCSQLVSLVDLPPTLLDAAGFPVPAEHAGPLASCRCCGGADGADWPDEVFIQISESQVGRAIRTRRWKYSRRRARSMMAGRTPERSAIVEECLYDLQADPYELDNRIGYRSHRPVADALRARLLRRMADAGEAPAGEAPPIIEPAPVTADNSQWSVLAEEIEA